MQVADAASMDHELFEGAACATSDLTARLSADLARANGQLALTEARCRAAAAAGLPVPLPLRVERSTCRLQVWSLRRVLDGMPTLDGECHAASA